MINKRLCSTTDSWVDTARGRLLARCWQPLERSGDFERRPPIVLFHDSLGCIELWRTFPAVLTERTGQQVIAYDRLGFGQSDRRTDKLGIDFAREEADSFFPALREQLGFDRFIAFGHSVGGGMAVHCAAKYATACDALITESAQAFVEDRTRAGIVEAQALFRQSEPFDRLQRYHGDKTRWVLDAWIDTWLSPEFSDWSLEGVLPAVRCPTLAIHGGEDEYGSAAHPQMIARLTGGRSELEVVPGVRHVPHREQESWVAQRVASFIAPQHA
jgi:pimeloyl-ACP methyl ester carboxylesterase